MSRRASSHAGVPIDYVLPLRWQSDAQLPELTGYLRWLSRHARVIVVDGSPAPLFGHHAETWSELVRDRLVIHVAPDPDGWLNGKVTGVHTGLAVATAEHVVIADDDVRYDAQSLRRTVDLLDEAHLVGPQNVFAPMPWHAKWDTARSLLNRSVAADYPGTFAVRRSAWVSMGGYNGDVLFENLELMRTVRAAGGRVLRPRDIYVVRRPTTLRGFLGQRVRQAYDDLAQPWRLAAYLPVLPVAATRRGRRIVVAGLLSSVALAEVGRRRDGGSAVFSPTASLFAPAWVLERSACSWIAVGQRVLRGGVRYCGQRLDVAAHSRRTLRRRVAPALVSALRAEADCGVRAVAERFAGRSPASAQGDGAPPRVDLVAIGVDDAERTAHEERPVQARRDDRVISPGGIAVDDGVVTSRLNGHVGTSARDDDRETGRRSG